MQNAYSRLEAESLQETPQTVRRRWVSISMMYIVCFVLFIQSSCYWTSLWPYMSQVDPSVSESFVGFVLAAYSIGMGLSAPLYGMWTNKRLEARTPILLGMSINIVGNLCIGLIEVFPPTSRHWVFLVARFICGCGAGSSGTVYAYISMASHLHERNKAMSFRSAVFSLAILAGPGLAAMSSPIGYPGYVYGPLHFDMYSCIAFLVCIVTAVMLAVVAVFFKECYVCVSRDEPATAIGNDPRVDKRAIFTCLAVRFTLLFGASSDESIASAYTMAMFSWTREQAVLYNSIIQMVCGVAESIMNLISGNIILRYCQERTLILGGIVCFVGFYIISFSYPGLPPVEITDGSTKEGCYYSWCEYTTRIYIGQYIAAYVFFVCLAFPLGSSANTILYSKILGPTRQGFMQGLYISTGSLSTALGPVVISNLFEYAGPRVSWILLSCMALICVLIVVVNFGHIRFDHKAAGDINYQTTSEEELDETAPLLLRAVSVASDRSTISSKVQI